MKPGQVSKTAEAVAAARAKHTIHDEPKIFTDCWAIFLTSPFWRIVCLSPWLSWLAFDLLYRSLRPALAALLCRARFVEDKLHLAAASQAVEYVILGAGFDSFALREAGSTNRYRVWEIDHPDTQRCKLRRIKTHSVAPLTNVHFIPADLCEEALPDMLANHGFRPRGTVFFSMLGLSYYLPRDIVMGLIEAMARCFPAGSELVIDIRVRPEFVQEEERASLDKVKRYASRRGEVMTTHFDPGVFVLDCRNSGMQLVECLSPAEQMTRYFTDRKDGLAPPPDVYLFHFRSVLSRT